MPETTLQPSSADSWLNKFSPNGKSGSGTTMYLNLNATYTYRPIVQFDMSSLAGLTIISAVLHLYRAGGTAATEIDVYRVKRTWVEADVTWNKYDASNNWGTAGCDGAADRGSTSMGSLTLDSNNDWQEISLTDATELNAMLADNHGMIVYPTGGAAGDWNFKTKEHADTTDRPKLVVTTTAAGTQILILASRIQDFYNDLKRGLLSPDQLLRRYREVYQI